MSYLDFRYPRIDLLALLVFEERRRREVEVPRDPGPFMVSFLFDVEMILGGHAWPIRLCRGVGSFPEGANCHGHC